MRLSKIFDAMDTDNNGSLDLDELRRCLGPDRAAIAPLLLDCFELTDDGFCAACGLRDKWTASYGGFEETFVSMRCKFRGQVGVRGWFSCSRFERVAAESHRCLRL